MRRRDRYSDRQTEQYNALLDIAEQHGPYDKSIGNEGAHYIDEDDNPFIDVGMICGNCVFFQEPSGCMIVSGNIEEEALCKLWIIPESRLEG